MGKNVVNIDREFASPSSSQSGQFLIEMMVAVSLIVIGMLGVFAVLSQSLGLSRVAANQYIAAHLAAEGVEVTKNVLDQNFINRRAWNLGFNNDTYIVEFDSISLTEVSENESQQPFLRFDENSKMYGYNSFWEETKFKREIIVDNRVEEIKITSRVYWKDRGGASYETIVEDRFKNWRTP